MAQHEQQDGHLESLPGELSKEIAHVDGTGTPAGEVVLIHPELHAEGDEQHRGDGGQQVAVEAADVDHLEVVGVSLREVEAGHLHHLIELDLENADSFLLEVLAVAPVCDQPGWLQKLQHDVEQCVDVDQIEDGVHQSVLLHRVDSLPEDEDQRVYD